MSSVKVSQGHLTKSDPPSSSLSLSSRGSSRWITTWWRATTCNKRLNPDRAQKSDQLVPKNSKSEAENDDEDDEKWPVFTTQISRCVNKRSMKGEPFVRYFDESKCIFPSDDEDVREINYMSPSSSSSSGSSGGGGGGTIASLMPLRTLQHHLTSATPTHSAMASIDLADSPDFTYTKLNRSLSAMSELATAVSNTTTTTHSPDDESSSPNISQHNNGLINKFQMTQEDSINDCSAAETTTGYSSWTPKFSSPFRTKSVNPLSRFKKPSKDSPKKNEISREELVKLFILKLDEEANYFKVTSSPDEEFCDCHKCQRYYGEYYAGYLDEYARRLQGQSQLSIQDIETSILSDEIINNGINICTIM